MEHYSNFWTFEIASLPNVAGHYLRKYGIYIRRFRVRKTCYEHVISNIFALKVRTSSGLDICTMEIVMILLNSKKKIEGFWNPYNLPIFKDVIGKVINFEYSISPFIIWLLIFLRKLYGVCVQIHCSIRLIFSVFCFI